MANEIPSVRRLRGIGGVTPFRSVFDRPGVPMYTEQQFADQPIGTPISPAGYGIPRPAPTVAAQYGLGAARQRLSPAMMQAMQQQRQQPAGFFDSLPSPMSPAGQALGAAATTGLQLSGWQDRPITLGQGLGAMAQAGMEAYKEAKALELEQQVKPEFKTVGDTLYRIEGGQITGVVSNAPKKTQKIKGEAGRIMTPDGRMTQAVYTEDGTLYEVGNMDQPLDPKSVKFIDQFTSQNVPQLEAYRENSIKPTEKTIKFIDRLAAQIQASPQGWVDRQKAQISTAIKRLAGNTDFTEEELNLALSQGTLTALVGASRLEIFGPGVLTESEQRLAREIFVGDFDRLTAQEALARLYSFREGAVDSYIEGIGRYNASPAASIKIEPFYNKKPLFDWGKWEQSAMTQQPTPSNVTAGGNTFTVTR